MKPRTFDYLRPHDLDELLATLTQGDVLLAGGQSLLPELNERRRTAARLIDLNAVPELKRCEIRADDVVLGALTRHRDLTARYDLRAAVPLLCHAAEHVGHAAVRTRGTLGGSIANADPAAELPGICVLLDATARLAGPEGPRTAPVAELLSPGGLRPREVIISVRVPRLARGEGWGFRELSRPGPYAFPLVTVAATMRLAANGTVREIRAAYTGAAPSPRAPRSALAPLAGRLPDADWIDAVAETLAATAEPAEDQFASAPYRRRMVRHLARATLREARDRAVPEVTG